MGEWEEIDTVPANVTHYTTIPSIQNYAYYVAAELHDSINPKVLLQKAESGPFSLAISNIAESEFDTGIESDDFSVSIWVYPTRAKNVLFVKKPVTSQQAKITILTQDGKEIMQVISGDSLTEIPLFAIAKGIYIVTVLVENQLVSHVISVE